MEYTGEKASYQVGATVFSKKTPRAYVKRASLPMVLSDQNVKEAQR